MTSNVDFTEQQQQSTDSGTIRPDMVVHMPERRDIVVDVKRRSMPTSRRLRRKMTRNEGTQLRRHAQNRRCAGSRAILESSTGRNSSAARISSSCSCGRSVLWAALQKTPHLSRVRWRHVTCPPSTSLIAAGLLARGADDFLQ